MLHATTGTKSESYEIMTWHFSFCWLCLCFLLLVFFRIYRGPSTTCQRVQRAPWVPAWARRVCRVAKASRVTLPSRPSLHIRLPTCQASEGPHLPPLAPLPAPAHPAQDRCHPPTCQVSQNLTEKWGVWYVADSRDTILSNRLTDVNYFFLKLFFQVTRALEALMLETTSLTGLIYSIKSIDTWCISVCTHAEANLQPTDLTWQKSDQKAKSTTTDFSCKSICQTVSRTHLKWCFCPSSAEGSKWELKYPHFTLFVLKACLRVLLFKKINKFGSADVEGHILWGMMCERLRLEGCFQTHCWSFC